MSATLRPEAIDSQLVFHVYVCLARAQAIVQALKRGLVSLEDLE